MFSTTADGASSPTERMRIRLGAGNNWCHICHRFVFGSSATSSTSNYINITNDATGTSSWANGMLIGVNDVGDALVWQNESRSLRFGTGNVDKMRLDESSGRLMIGTTTEGAANADNLTIADSGHAGITIRSGTSSNASVFFSDATSGAGEYEGVIGISA